MISLTGKTVCIRCGESFEWTARKIERGEICLSTDFFNTIASKNAELYENNQGYYAVTICPKCRHRETAMPRQ